MKCLRRLEKKEASSYTCSLSSLSPAPSLRSPFLFYSFHFLVVSAPVAFQKGMILQPVKT